MHILVHFVLKWATYKNNCFLLNFKNLTIFRFWNCDIPIMTSMMVWLVWYQSYCHTSHIRNVNVGQLYKVYNDILGMTSMMSWLVSYHSYYHTSHIRFGTVSKFEMAKILKFGHKCLFLKNVHSGTNFTKMHLFPTAS